MSKLQLSLTSLIAVVPAGFLIFLLVNVMMTHSQNLSTIAFVVLGMTLVSAATTVLIPAGVWIGGRKKPKLATAKVSSGASTADDEEAEEIDDGGEADAEALDLEEEASDSYSVEESLGESSDFDLETDEEMSNDLEADIDTEPVEDFEEFDLEEEEVEEEPPPKKKKK